VSAGPDAAYFVVDDLEWADDAGTGEIPPEMLDEARRRGGGGRKILARGEGGFHSTYSEMPPGYTMPPHRHDTDEIVVVLDGSCTFSAGGNADSADARVLRARDSVVLPAGRVHGFACGPEGLKLLTISREPYATELVDG
jgi:quercetin dioxygenase-like cupin family protein